MAHVIISRDHGWWDSIRKYAILLNGKVEDIIGEGEVITLNLEKGNYELHAKIGWCRSNKLNFSVANSDDENRILIKSPLRGPGILLGLFYVFFLPTKYLKAEEI